MIKLFLILIPLFLLSCNSQKIIEKKENIKENIVEYDKKSSNNVYIFYEDFSKESLLVEMLSEKLLSLNFRVITIPISQISQYNKYYVENQNNVIFSLGNSIYKMDKVLKHKYNYLIIDTPNKYGKISIDLKEGKTLLITDFDTMKYTYKILQNKKFNIYMKEDKFAWLLMGDNSIKELLNLTKEESRLDFKQKKETIYLNRDFKSKLLILFTMKTALLKKCNTKCVLKNDTYINSVYVPINNDFYTSKEVLLLSKNIKKIFNLIKEKKYLDSYLLLEENKKVFNYSIFKKIFDFIEEPLYKLEPDLIRRKNGEY